MKSKNFGTDIPIYESISEFDKNLPDTVEILRTSEDDKVYLIGTAHFSLKSQDDVSLVMRNVRPEGVVLELCPLRIHILQYDEETLLREAGNISPAKVKEIIAEHGVTGGMFYISFLNMSANITKQLGVAPGGECRRAVAECKELGTCKVMLGDRPINITMKRAMSGLTFAQKMKLSMYLNSSDPNQKTITAEDVERYKDRDIKPMESLKEHMPSIYRAFVSERDTILAHSLLLSTKVLKHFNQSEDPVKVVGVVGMGHMNGIINNFGRTTTEEVSELMRMPGLDDSMYNYIYSFTNNEVGGQQLLNIRPYELEQLGMYSIGHQEIVLEAVEHLRNFHYNLDKENLQFLALHVATAARSLYKQLAYYCDTSKIETQILNDITRTIATIKPVIIWLDRAPFHGQLQFNEIRKNMLRLGLEMATSAQRDRFVENPVEQIRMSAEKLAKLADYIIQDITDPMLLQPASLSLVTLKKRESELGFNIVPSYHGIHRVSDIKYNSPAHNSGKIEDGDEIVQINYQTVVGWQYKTVILQLRESPPDVLLTLKKRPKHTKIYGQIYMQPYRLPSKKRAPPGRWGENLPSPRAPEFLPVQAVQDFTLPLKINEKHTSSDTDSSCSDILTPTDPKSGDKEIRLYLPKPRAVLQRRHTICGDELSHFKNVGNAPLWHERKGKQNGDSSSPSLRDKSVSFGFGLEITPRPTTCLGISANGKLNDLVGLNNSLPEISVDKAPSSDANKEETEDKSKPGVSKVVRFDAAMKYEDYPLDNKYICNVENTILETFEPIPYADEEDIPTTQITEKEKKEIEKIEQSSIQKTEERDVPEKSRTINKPLLNRRGRLDKSHSTPAYDNSGEDSDTPPPRPKRQVDIQPPVLPPHPPKPQNLCQTNDRNPATLSPPPKNLASPSHNPPVSVHFLQETSLEETELVTPTKTKSLTLKKKNSLLAKRRKVTLKALGTGDIQGHLYRRTKDKRGVTFWAKLYFVLIETVLYGFRAKDAQKANCMVFLPGFTVSIAKEVHSKPHAFKVYHPSKTFYFAAESVEALNQWMEFIRQAAMQDKSAVATDSSNTMNIKDFFSETDSSGDESEIKQLSTPSPITTNMNNPKDNSSKTIETPTSSKHDKYLGSLKKFTKTNLPFKSNDKKPSSDIPVPTAQFRSYRKVPGGSYGLQIGTSSLAYPDNNTPPLQYYIERNRKQSITSTQSADCKASGLIDLEDHYNKGSRDITTFIDKPKKFRKTSPYNYIHASNPNLVEFDFQTSKTLDFSLPKINSSNSWDAHNTLQGFVTLKDLMLQKQEEEAQEMYNNRVFLGVEKKDDRFLKYQHKKGRGHDDGAQPGSSGKLSKIQSRSLPKTPDYEMSFKPDDEDIKRIRNKEGLKLRDFGYEFIYGDDPSSSASGNTKNSQAHHSSNINSSKKKYSSSSASDSHEKSNRGGSFKKTKGKFEAFKTSSEKLFQFKHSSNESESKSLKSSSSYSPMTLPLNKKSSQIYSIQMGHSGSQGNIKKSHTYNADFKDKKFDAPRKNSAPMPILSKFSFSSGNKTIKERKLLGSPRLHRAIFGRTVSTSSNQSDFDHEIFSPIVFTRQAQIAPESSIDVHLGAPTAVSQEKVPPITVTPDYPNMECPPVFEPETYSLSDPNASLTLLRRRNNIEE